MKLDHLVILAGSLEASLGWYEIMLRLLGFRKTRDHVWSNEEGFAIDLQAAKPATPAYQRYAAGLNHLGFSAADEAALDAVRAGMAAAGFDVPEKQRFGTDVATFFRDPDGMRIEVIAYGGAAG